MKIFVIVATYNGEYLQVADYFPSTNSYRIIQSRFFDSVEAHWVFDFYPSNFDKIKRNTLKRAITNKKDNLPF
ncbi:MAG: hypothetical protein COA68_17550 [Oceanobacter sp.]|nr:MAG: hypothetical protein COA68_17550 [Oceanobacter sp.]